MSEAEAQAEPYEPTIEDGLDTQLIHLAWCRGTSAIPGEWSRANPSRGQCVMTSLLVQALTGGRILRGTVGGEEHYWNLHDYGVETDLTLSQFGADATHDEGVEEAEREALLANPDTKERYRIFLARLYDAGAVRSLIQIAEAEDGAEAA